MMILLLAFLFKETVMRISDMDDAERISACGGARLHGKICTQSGWCDVCSVWVLPRNYYLVIYSGGIGLTVMADLIHSVSEDVLATWKREVRGERQ